jgi:hypothetical protein
MLEVLQLLPSVQHQALAPVPRCLQATLQLTT